MTLSIDEMSLFSVLSPLPWTNLAHPGIPIPGILMSTPSICSKKFTCGDGKCRKHYEDLKISEEGVVTCPFGFGSYKFIINDDLFAFTGFVSSPRSNSISRRRGKEFPKNRFNPDELKQIISRIQNIINEASLSSQVEHLEALHEVRRLNQISKVILEGLERKPPSGDKIDLTRALKATELMSLHLDALDFVANPDLIKTRTGIHEINFYKVVDKICKIYRALEKKKKLKILLSGESYKRIRCDERFFHIIPSVFVDNSIKYAPLGTEIHVNVKEYSNQGEDFVKLTVTSQGPRSTPEEESRIFIKKGRGRAAKETSSQGAGCGLFICSKIAEGIGGFVDKKQKYLPSGLSEWSFVFYIKTSS
ncbi:MAG: hypothetical protein LBM75_01415 [Myxococcales bacterium]|jgi:hypothetical protein|nr:hypothetical protein [Myxococcales bacterium]